MNFRILNFVLLAAITGVFAYADDHPSPGMTMRTNSAACIAKHKSMHDLLASYFNGVPAMNTLKRIDVLTGGVLVNDATSAMPTGKLKTQLYSIASTYGSDPIGTLSGKQTISEDYYSNNWMVYSKIKMVDNSGITVLIESNHSDCNPTTLANQLTIKISKRIIQNGEPIIGQITLTFDSSKKLKLCEDPTKKIIDFINEEKSKVLAFTNIELGNSITVDSIDTEAELTAVADSLATTNYSTIFPNYNFNQYRTTDSLSHSIMQEFYNLYSEEITDYNFSTLEEKKKDVRNRLRYFLNLKKLQIADQTFITELSNSSVFKNTTLGSICSKAK